jgi:hypothetical protein
VDKATQGILQGEYRVAAGDLVSIYFGPGFDEEVGIFMEFDSVNRLRSMIFWDGEIYSIPTQQITRISRAS